MGGSVAGLCAAGALSANYDQVIVLERDERVDSLAPRRGAPQSSHFHLLLNRGRAAMDRLFPGLFAAMARDGAVNCDFGGDVNWYQFGAWKLRERQGIPTWLQSRSLLERHLRRELLAKGNTELRFAAAVDAPVHRDGQVCGVRLRGGEVIDADLVVDATGRGSHSRQWLAEWGYGEVPERRVRVGLAYVSGVFELAADKAEALGQDVLAIHQHPPAHKRGGIVARIEGGRVVVTMMGYHGDHPPTELSALREWSKTLSQPAVYELLSDATLIGGLNKYTYPYQRRLGYEQLRRLPENYLVLGDALCSVDPTFGQGMSVAATQAELVGKRAAPGRRTRRIQRQLAALAEVPWSLTASEAHRWHETRGWQPHGAGIQRMYTARLFELSSRSHAVYQALLRVMHLDARPMALFHPRVFWQVLFG